MQKGGAEPLVGFNSIVLCVRGCLFLSSRGTAETLWHGDTVCIVYTMLPIPSVCSCSYRVQLVMFLLSVIWPDVTARSVKTLIAARWRPGAHHTAVKAPSSCLTAARRVTLGQMTQHLVKPRCSQTIFFPLVHSQEELQQLQVP